MPLHPILVLDQVIDDYRNYIRTEFRAKDPALNAALEAELDRPRFLAQEPFFQAHRPFRSGKAWPDLPLDPRLARAMTARTGGAPAYLHQSAAIEELCSPTARPVVVTTGTGSGKTECFLLPVIQNAIEDVARFRQPGLTAILVYPMNALANDQLLRIEQYLEESGFQGAVTVAKYDRGTTQAQREDLRRKPPHILLTNYMMLEYLLVRPADRDGIFANHRCRFLVLDEVHTYRGTLGSNIALLVRRLRTHLQRARQDWRTEVSPHDAPYRFPTLVPVGTSATIKSVSEEDLSRQEALRLRDAAVQDFFARLTGVEPATIQVIGEEVEEVQTPPEAQYALQPPAGVSVDVNDSESVRQALCTLAGIDRATPLADAARQCRLLWDLHHWLIRQPLSITDLVDRVRQTIPGRTDAPLDAVYHEVATALIAGAALPDGTPGALRLRSHRFIRGGWQFHRCLNPACGRLYPLGEAQCSTCGYQTAPLHLCRNCGADYLQLAGDPLEGPLHPFRSGVDEVEWMLYEPSRFETTFADEESEDEPEEETPRARNRRQRNANVPTQMRRRPVLHGSFDPRTLSFSANRTDYPLEVILAPARIRCLCCGGTAGSRNVVAPLSIGTSAALKVLGEGLLGALDLAHRTLTDHDGKERLLIFCDSRQDAAHQARFITFASRYDRMRRNLVRLLEQEGPLTIQRAVELLADRGVRERDNPHVPEAPRQRLSLEERERIRAWEEAPVLDELALSASYRATLINLGLVGVVYEGLHEVVQESGSKVAEALDIDLPALEHLCRCLLDEIRMRGALSRPMLRYHPQHTSCPRYVQSAEWERAIKVPQGYPLDAQGELTPSLNADEIPPGVRSHNAWRRAGVGGRPPSLARILTHLLERYGRPRTSITDRDMLAVLEFLVEMSFLTPVELFGFQDSCKLLQLNEEFVQIALLREEQRARCQVCGAPLAGAPVRSPCPACHGAAIRWTDAELAANRTVQRIRAPHVVPLVAAEHTAQVPNADRVQLETDFKAPAAEAKLNLLACSPTMEMGIDVGGLDAVALRNIPPRPDNYAQRGGRAGRRSRVGLVLGYARSTPHDQYFYDQPGEMIAGEVPAPALALGNRDVLLRHINAIVFGAADPGLAGRMGEYVNPKGELAQEKIDELLAALAAQVGYGQQMAQTAFGPILTEAGLTDEHLQEHFRQLPDRVRDLFQRTARQVIELGRALDRHRAELQGQGAAMHAGAMIRRLLGIRDTQERGSTDADDRSAGYPLRRFAEFGLLPGYEFPTEPATVRLLGDRNEDDPVSTSRAVGLAQFQPDAQVYARAKRWKVFGLDTASPWNPQPNGPSWLYQQCGRCGLRFQAQEPRCPRCHDSSPGATRPAYQFGGFIARRDEAPVLNEEERIAMRNSVRSYPQWNGAVSGRWRSDAWSLRLSQQEEVCWLNEGPPPSQRELETGLILSTDTRGFLLCGHCGAMLRAPEATPTRPQGRRNARSAQQSAQTFGHHANCPQSHVAPAPLALVTAGRTEVLRLLTPVPASTELADLQPWALSLGYALHIGIARHFMLDSSEIEFILEGPWQIQTDGQPLGQLSLTFIDPSVGGTGYLRRTAEELHLVARRALQHLEHDGCETACYRCLKSYTNQRFHDYLQWPLALPALEMLAARPAESQPPAITDLDDPTPWLEAYDAGVGSPLELKFLRLFEQHAFLPQKQFAITLDNSPRPLTIADFAVPERRLAIYIDGAAVHVGANLRRDRYIRTRLQQADPPWAVVTLQASDLSEGATLVERLRRL